MSVLIMLCMNLYHFRKQSLILAGQGGGSRVRCVKGEWGNYIFHRKAITLLAESAMT
jgi:hypothetical protein